MRRHPPRSQVPRPKPLGDVFFGANPVLEMLLATPEAVQAVFVTPGSGAAQVVAERARALDVAVEMTDRAALDRLTGGGHHQGVAARTRPFAYATLDGLLEARASLLVALDGVTDPQNLGAIIRSAEVLGAGGLIIQRDRCAPVTPAAVRASSGACAHLPIAQVVNLVRALAAAKDRGYWVVGLDPEGSLLFQDLPPLELALLVVGSEGRGTRPLVVRACDFRVRIPAQGRVASLNASVATGIGLYVLRERQLAGRTGGRPSR